MLDVVYIVKPTLKNEELRYSLRSLQNLPHGRVFVFGGKFNWFSKEVISVPLMQKGATKWERSANTLKQVVDNENVGEEFVLFNDDFFVMKPIKELGYFHDRTLEARIGDFKALKPMGYRLRLKQASESLTMRNKGTFNYELHIPMKFDKAKLRALWDIYPNIGAKRSLYGNEYAVKSKQREDCKIYDNYSIPNPTREFLSTTDISFESGRVGKYIRNKFKEPSIYERA